MSNLRRLLSNWSTFQCHPDLYPNNPAKTEEYIQLQSSYNSLMSSQAENVQMEGQENHVRETNFAEEIDWEFLKRLEIYHLFRLQFMPIIF